MAFTEDGRHEFDIKSSSPPPLILSSQGLRASQLPPQPDLLRLEPHEVSQESNPFNKKDQSPN